MNANHITSTVLNARLVLIVAAKSVKAIRHRAIKSLLRAGQTKRTPLRGRLTRYLPWPCWSFPQMSPGFSGQATSGPGKPTGRPSWERGVKRGKLPNSA